MNFTPNAAQQRAIDFYEADISASIGERPISTRKPRFTTNELRAFVVERWRELGHPPRILDLNPHRYAVIARFGKLGAAQRRAALLLTPQERIDLVYRCQFCGQAGFCTAKGWKAHEKHCERRGDESQA